EGGLARFLLRHGPADVKLTDARTLVARAKRVHELRVWRRGNQAVALLTRDPRRRFTGGRDVDRRRLVRQGVDAGVIDDEVVAAMVDELAGPQLTDDVDGFA